MKSITLDASKFSVFEKRTFTVKHVGNAKYIGSVSYVIEHNSWIRSYAWHVTVDGVIVDMDIEHEQSCYWDADGLRVVGFISLDAAMAHMNAYAKEPKEYIEDYCQMVRDAFC